ncbi:MAG: hypothetical protein NWQ45_00295, partial [Congregibacter sp.]|nr:hypothetical protein [Congregibacter sp.]
LGALSGGYIAGHLDEFMSWIPQNLMPEHTIVIIFAVSSVLRLFIVAWFIPHSKELRVRRRPDLLRVIYRISRFTPGAGIVVDWLTVTRRERDTPQDPQA